MTSLSFIFVLYLKKSNIFKDFFEIPRLQTFVFGRRVRKRKFIILVRDKTGHETHKNAFYQFYSKSCVDLFVVNTHYQIINVVSNHFLIKFIIKIYSKPISMICCLKHLPTIMKYKNKALRI